jgi:hypothetical protein
MPGQPFAQGLPIAGVEGFERGGCEGRFASGARFLDRAAGVAETIASLPAQGSPSNAMSALSSRR